MTATAKAAPSMPRMAETAGAFFDALALVSRCGYVTEYCGVVYPTVRAYGLGDFTMNSHGEFLALSHDGICTAALSAEQHAQIVAAIEADQISVLLLTRPGFGSDYGTRKLVKVIHQPRGNWEGTEKPLSMSAL